MVLFSIVKNKNLESLRADFGLLRDPDHGTKQILSELKKRQKSKTYLTRWLALSQEHPTVSPSQGLLKTPFDYLDYQSVHMLPISRIYETLAMRWFFLKLFNHPYRLNSLLETTKRPFIAPKKIAAPVFTQAEKNGLSLSIGDLAASVVGADHERASRTERYAHGPFLKLGKYARIPFVGSASPDVWNSSLAIATMAASHALTCIPRNGVLAQSERQTDVAREVFEILDELADTLLSDNPDRERVTAHWKSNIMGTVEADPAKALVRTEMLFKAGVRTFRVYSPEPGTGPVETVTALRKQYGDEIEIFTGQIIDVKQAVAACRAGADGLYLGIGGGGRCITGVRSGSAIEWPALVWNLRGEIDKPVLVEGGASDHIAVTLLLGASGIGVTRVVGGGTIESPGGALFFVDSKGKLFKPYGGEASARTKYLDGKLLPFGIPSFVEGETTKAYLSYIKHAQPTLTYNLHLLLEDAILALVFRNVETIEKLQAINPSPLMQSTSLDLLQRGTH